MDKRILLNSSWLIVSQFSAKIIAFFYTIFLANQLGVNKFGLWILVLSYFSLFSSISDLGTTRYLLREVSKNRNDSKILISSVIIIRFLILIIIACSFIGILYLLDPQIDRRTLSILGVIAVVPQSLSITLDAVFIAKLKNRLSSLGTILLNVFAVVIGIVLISLGYGINGALYSLILSQFLYAGLMVIFAINNKYWFFEKIRWSIFPEIIKGSIPYGILGAMGLIFFKVDSIILSFFKGNFETGIYGAAFKFLEASLIIPNAVAFSIFPIMAKFHLKDSKLIKPLYTNTVFIMAVTGIITASVFIIVLPFVIEFLLPQFKLSIGVLQILSIAIPFMFMHVTMSQAALSSEKYLRPLIIMSIVTLLFNIVLNIIFIPKYGYLAAAWITVASDILSFLIIYITLNKFIFKQGINFN